MKTQVDAKVKSIASNDNKSALSNIFDGNCDTCWMSNGMDNLEICFESTGIYSEIEIEFQKGFQPSIVILTVNNGETKEIKCLKTQSSIKINDIGAMNLENFIRIQFILPYDPYKRICIYSINFYN